MNVNKKEYYNHSIHNHIILFPMKLPKCFSCQLVIPIVFPNLTYLVYSLHMRRKLSVVGEGVGAEG